MFNKLKCRLGCRAKRQADLLIGLVRNITVLAWQWRTMAFIRLWIVVRVMRNLRLRANGVGLESINSLQVLLSRSRPATHHIIIRRAQHSSIPLASVSRDNDPFTPPSSPSYRQPGKNLLFVYHYVLMYARQMLALKYSDRMPQFFRFPSQPYRTYTPDVGR